MFADKMELTMKPFWDEKTEWNSIGCVLPFWFDKRQRKMMLKKKLNWESNELQIYKTALYLPCTARPRWFTANAPEQFGSILRQKKNHNERKGRNGKMEGGGWKTIFNWNKNYIMILYIDIVRSHQEEIAIEKYLLHYKFDAFKQQNKKFSLSIKLRQNVCKNYSNLNESIIQIDRIITHTQAQSVLGAFEIVLVELFRFHIYSLCLS